VAKALVRAAKLRGYREGGGVSVCVRSAPKSKQWAIVDGVVSGVDDVALSSALHGDAVTLDVFDNDALTACLYRDGVEVDVFASDGGEALGRSARATAGQPLRWDSICAKGAGHKDIKALFKRARAAGQGPDAGLETLMLELGALIGLSEEAFGPNQSAEGSSVLVSLTPPAPAKLVPMRGPPALVSVLGPLDPSPHVQVSLGNGPSASAYVVTNHGGPGDVELWLGGGAIERGLVRVDRVAVDLSGAYGPTHLGARLLDPKSHAATLADKTCTPRQDGSGASWLIASLGQLPGAQAPEPGVWRDRGSFLTQDPAHNPAVGVRVDFTPLKEGEDSLFVKWKPLSHADGVELVARVVVTP
jgi:hypothetical protein